MPRRLLLSLLLVAACSTQDAPQPAGDVPPDSSKRAGGERVESANANDLQAMGEPRLSGYTPTHADEAYRITVVPSFTPAYAVRMERYGERVRVVTTVLNGAGGYEPGVPVRRDSAIISRDSVDAFAARVDGAGFWRWPQRGKIMGVDGDEWVLEGFRGGSYHLVLRWTPDSTGEHPAFLALARALLRMGGLDPPPSTNPQTESPRTDSTG